MLRAKREEMEKPAWFQQQHPQTPLKCVAYFSMEFMLSEALPIYSGGLGNVAGDQLKAASDLGVPVVGVGLLYQQGYFRQVIDKDGAQQALFPYNDPGQLPITPSRQPNGEWLRKRFLERIDEPDKNWKFSLADIHERKYWKQYMEAYEACLAATSTHHAPWYVVPADDKENARLIVSQILLDAFRELKMAYPKTTAKRLKELESIRKQL